MLNVLVANYDKAEGESWRVRLEKRGYNIAPECNSLSAMVYILSREKIHIVVCSMNLIEKNAFTVINAITDFFPRVKVVLVGKPQFGDTAAILNGAKNVVVKMSFDTELDKYVQKAAEPSAYDNLDADRLMTLLLGEHYLSNEEAALILGRLQPSWVPKYVVLSITTDSYFREAFKVIELTLKSLANGYALRFSLNEVCVVLQNSPTVEQVFGIADVLRGALLTKTDATFSIGISRPRDYAGMLYASRNEALRAAQARHLYGQNSLIHINYLGDNDIEYVYPYHKQKRLIEQTLDGNRKKALELLEEIFDVFRSREGLSQGLLNKFALGMLVALNTSAASKSRALEQIQLDSLSFGKLLEAKTPEDTFVIMKEGIESFVGEMDAFADIRRDALFLQLTELKAQKANITVSDLIRTFHTTISFLNRAVAQNSGGNIFDYLKG